MSAVPPSAPSSAPTSSAPDPTAPVCVLGLGLIGGSLLRALHDARHEVFGYNRSSETVDAASADGYDASTDLVATLTRAAERRAVTVLATPVTTIEPLIEAIAEHAPHVLLTDVISVKEEVERTIARLHPDGRYVGGHPMAGTSHSGWPATDPTLFDGAMWAVTTTDTTRADDWLTVASIALTVGSRVVPVAPDAHDRAVAAISHLPHLTAAATAAVGAGESDLALRLAAGSFRDGTRVAGTAPSLQRAMIEANGIAVLNVLSATIDRLIAARDELRDHGTARILVDDGHRARSAYEALHAGAAEVISGVTIGDDGWQQELRRQAHEGRVWVG